MKGKFITIYGINNIGKSTQAKMLVERLNASGHRAIHIKYPIYDLEPTGPLLNNILRSKSQEMSEEELQTLFVRNRIEFEPRLIQYLAEGYIVVAEDYVGTGIAWGTAKGADMEWLEAINAPLLQEDMAIYMKGKRFLQGREHTHIHETDDELAKKCEAVFEELADKYKWKEVLVVDGKEIVANRIWELLEDFLRVDAGEKSE